MMVPEGGSAKLVCKARGFPKPRVVWRREDGGEIIVRGGPQGKSKGKFLINKSFIHMLLFKLCIFYNFLNFEN